jgi:hypothetical protein
LPTVHLTSTAAGSDPIDREALQLTRRCERAIRVDRRFAAVEDPDAADLIVLIEPKRRKLASYERVLSEHPLVRSHAERCFAYDCAERPAGFLPGIYPQLRRAQWDPARMVAGGFLAPCDPEEGIGPSRFAVCRRGGAAATYRIYEAMSLAKIPVIVSDHWVAPDGPDWPRCAIVVAESRIDEVPRIIRERQHQADEMCHAARLAWEQHFAPGLSVVRMLEAVERISLLRGQGETLAELRARWSSQPFKKAGGWARTQRAARLLGARETRWRGRSPR